MMSRISIPNPWCVIWHLGPVIADTGSHDLDPPPPTAPTTCPTTIRTRGSQKLEMKIKRGDAFMMAIVAVVSSSDAFIPASSTTGWSSIPSRPTTARSSTTTSENQEWDVDLYQKHSFVFKLGSSLVELLDPRSGEVILDVGCGSGQLTDEISKHGARAIGFDADGSMVARCQHDFPDLEFFQADAADFDLPDPVDAIFSNAALHWVKRAEAATICMSRALKPGGRFVVEFGGKGNVARIVQASNHVLGKTPSDNPWYFPSIAEYSALLEQSGIEVLSAQLYDRPTPLQEGPDGMANWLRMFGGILFQDVPDGSKEKVIQEIVARLKDEEDSLFDGVGWTADYRRLRIVGRKVQ